MTALKGVVKHAGKSVSPATRTRIYTLLKDLIHHVDDQVRMFASSILGVISQVLGRSILRTITILLVLLLFILTVAYLHPFGLLGDECISCISD